MNVSAIVDLQDMLNEIGESEMSYILKQLVAEPVEKKKIIAEILGLNTMSTVGDVVNELTKFW